jgi:predicted ATP-binding protein involved in virulence
MLKKISLEEFTVFSKVEISFSPGINVIIGQNGSGKTHLLKVAYLFNRAWADLISKSPSLSQKRVEAYFEDRLIGLFQPDNLADLIRRGKSEECTLSTEIHALIPTIFMDSDGKTQKSSNDKIFPFRNLTEHLSWSFSIRNNQELNVSQKSVLNAKKIPNDSPINSRVPRSVFIPSKEIVSWYEGLVGLFSRYELKLDASYKDLAEAIDSPKLSTQPSLLSSLLDELKQELRGTLQLENGKFIFLGLDGNRTNAPMMAEGFRKLALLPYLIDRNVIKEKGETLFWDEPEANLNASYIRWMAKALVCLAQEGVQVILATHSLFLLREIDMLTKTGKIPARFISLTPADNEVTIEQADDVEEIQSIASLEAELEQNDRIQNWYAETA